MKQKMNIIFLIALSIVNMVFNIIYFPDNKQMMEYQFDFFTTITVLAGFSFTALGILLSLTGEKIFEKLKDTSILNTLYINIVRSIRYLLYSSIISLFFILGFDKQMGKIPVHLPYLNVEKVRIFIYSIECGFVILGMVYFLKAMSTIAQIISKMFPDKSDKIKTKEKEYKDSFQRVKEKRKKNEQEEDNNSIEDEW